MKVGKTYCTRCGREVTGFTCDNCDPTIAVKQLTLDQLRDQFEKWYSKYQFRYKYKLKNKLPNGEYKSPYLRGLLKSWIQCANANGILKC